MGKKVAKVPLTNQQLTDEKGIALQRTATFLGAALLFSSVTAPVLVQVAEAEQTNVATTTASSTNAGINEQEVELHTYNSATLHSEDKAETTETETQAETQATTNSDNSLILVAPDSDSDEADTDAENEEQTEEPEEVIEAPRNSPDILDHIAPIDFSPVPMARSASSTQTSFITDVASHAQGVAAENDLYASVMIAQAILESGWGKSTLSQAPYYNLFGIKGSYNGKSVTMSTREVIDGRWVTIQAAFRQYPSYRESFADNAYVLKNSKVTANEYRYTGAWKSNTKSYKDATAWLQGRYATDDSYAAKLNNLITTYDLTKYDTATNNNQTDNSGNGTTNQSTNDPSTTTPTNGTWHTIVSGDTLWSLAQRYGTTVAQLKQWNNLSSDAIYAGQKLLVKAEQTNNANAGNQTNSDNGANTEKPSTSTTDQTNATRHKVVSGDTLWNISRKYGVTVANLKQWNQLSSDIIYIGQQLVVKVTSGGSNSSTGGSQTQDTTTGSNANNGGTHLVKRGDTLWSIAKQYGVSVNELKARNHLTSDLIFIGQRLMIGSSASTANTPAISQGAAANGTYKVVPGDTLWRISQRYGVTVKDLKSWNNLKSDFIFIGQTLKVSKATTASTTTNSNQAKHTVQRGDTLWHIAQQQKTTVQKLKQLNGLVNDTIYIGQQLRVS